MTDNLNTLADRCEAASGPDRELDADIALTQGWAEFPGDNWCGPEGQIAVPYYTASLDDAMTLVPKGWSLGQWSIIGKPNTSRIWKDEHDITTSAATPALALAAAALRARSETNG